MSSHKRNANSLDWRQIAPRVAVYPQGSPAPPLEPGWIALPQSSPREFVFGDGSHPTTRLCAAAVDYLCRQRHPHAVLDVGTGTGILARIARARGAQIIAGTDIDATALKSALEQAALDAHAVTIRFGSEAPDRSGALFDLVVANILEEPLRLLAPSLVRALRPGGLLLLSGFTRLQVPAVQRVYEQQGLTLVSQAGLEGWALLTFEHRQGI